MHDIAFGSIIDSGFSIDNHYLVTSRQYKVVDISEQRCLGIHLPVGVGFFLKTNVVYIDLPYGLERPSILQFQPIEKIAMCVVIGSQLSWCFMHFSLLLWIKICPTLFKS